MSQADTAAPFSPADFTHTLVAHQPKLLAFVRGLVGDPEQARDIVQQVFCDAWRAAQQGKRPFIGAEDEAAVRGWLFHAAYCDAASALRRRKLIQWESLDAPSRAESEHSSVPRLFEDEVAERCAVRAALASLSPEDASCLLLSAIQGLTAAEIARIVGISPEACKKRMSRARQRLRAAYLAQNSDT